MAWRDNLVPGSFRGVRFLVDAHDFTGGRRLARHEMPLRDKPVVQDLGRASHEFTINAYVIADFTTGDYMAARDALVRACDGTAGPGTLNHPWLGTGLTVCCRSIRLREDKSRGGEALYEITFWEGDDAAPPATTPSTQAGFLSGIAGVQAALGHALGIATQIITAPGILLSNAVALLGGFVGPVIGVLNGANSILGATCLVGGTQAQALFAAMQAAGTAATALPTAPSQGVGPVTSTITGITADPVVVAVTDLASLLASAVQAVANAQAPAPDIIGGNLATAARLQADVTLGVAGLATYGATLPAPQGLRPDLQAALQGNLLLLLNGAITLAVANIYANTDFTSSNAAAAARTTLLALINAQVFAAAAAANDPLYQAWLALSGLANADLIARITQLPSLTRYSLPASVPACVLAQSLYQDATRATQLVLLNDMPHPAFMPAAGVALSF